MAKRKQQKANRANRTPRTNHAASLDHERLLRRLMGARVRHVGEQIWDAFVREIDDWLQEENFPPWDELLPEVQDRLLMRWRSDSLFMRAKRRGAEKRSGRTVPPNLVLKRFDELCPKFDSDTKTAEYMASSRETFTNTDREKVTLSRNAILDYVNDRTAAYAKARGLPFSTRAEKMRARALWLQEHDRKEGRPTT